MDIKQWNCIDNDENNFNKAITGNLNRKHISKKKLIE